MKKTIILVLIAEILSIVSVQAQRIIWQDDFETSKGWAEFDEGGSSSTVIDGVLKVKAGKGKSAWSKCKTHLDGKKDFTISFDAKPKGGLWNDRYFGIMIDYFDTKNYKVFYLEKGRVFFEEYAQGKLVRFEKDYLKKLSRTEAKNLNIVLKKEGNTTIFTINDEEVLEIDGINVSTNRIALMVSDDLEVSFDNVKIMQ